MRVQPSIAYDSDSSELGVRAWVENEYRLVVEDPLVLVSCTAELVDKGGTVVSSAVGSVDPTGNFVAAFTLSGFSPSPGDHYLLILALRTATETHGPRTIGIPVN